MQALAQGCAVHRQGRVVAKDGTRVHPTTEGGRGECRKELNGAELLLRINCHRSLRSCDVCAFIFHGACETLLKIYFDADANARNLYRSDPALQIT